MEFKGIEFLADYRKSIKVSIVDLYTELYIKNFNGISDNAVTLEDIVSTERGIVIKGEPGTGKSTFLKYFIRCYIEKSTSVIPFIISLEHLGRYVEKLEICQKKDAEAIIIRYLRNEYPQPQFLFQEDFFETIFYKKECWFFFDGFDEINSNRTQGKVLCLIQFLYDIWDKCKFVITSRPYALDDFKLIENFQVVYIDVLNRIQMEQYINSLSKILNINQYSIDANGLISIICHNNTIYQLARTPVMLTFICIIYFIKENIPESRYEIFEKIIVWLISSKDVKQENQEEQVNLYSQVAYYMTMSKIKEIDEDILCNKFAGNQKKHAFIKKINDTGILIKKNTGKSNKKYLFWHYCFQEFLAARYIANKLSLDKNYQTIIDIWFDKDFQEIIVLLSSSLLYQHYTLIKPLINRISSHLYKLPIEKTIIGAGLLGKIIEESFPNISFLDECNEWKKLKEKLKILFEVPLSNVGANDKYNAAVALGLSGDDRLNDFNHTFSKIKGGKFYIGAQKDFHWGRNYDFYATEFESPVKEMCINEFYIRKFPITVQEYEKFILNDGYSLSDEIWTQEGILWRTRNNIVYPRNWRNQICLRNSPVTGVSWYEAVAYCNWLTTIHYDDCIYRLPTEAEWEYAYKFCYNNTKFASLDINCYTDSESIRYKTPIGMFPSSTSYNGVTDMLGNVEEWCMDSWSMSLDKCCLDGKAWINKNEIGAVTRGGSTIRTLRLCRGTYRARCNKNARYDTIGFRIIKTKK